MRNRIYQFMKSPVQLLFIVVSLLVFQSAHTQENIKDTHIVTTVFKAFKEQNENVLLKSLATKEEIDYLIPKIKESHPDENIPEADEIIEVFKTSATKNFKEIIERGSSFGVAWENIVLEKAEFESNPHAKLGIERGNITLVCASNDKKFLIILKKSYKIQDTWRLMDRMKFTLL